MDEQGQEKVFISLSTEGIATLIEGAKDRVIYAAPGLFRPVAEAIVMFFTKRSSIIEVVLDPDPEVCRLGYGELGALDYLLHADIIPRKAEGFRIGILIVDNHAWIFSPTPLVVEEGPKQSRPNAVSVTEEYAHSLLRSISPRLGLQGQEDIVSDLTTPLPEVGIEKITDSDMDRARKDLDLCPPLPFDLARRVRVYQAHVQFVELSLEGVHIDRHTVRLPSEILSLPKSDEFKERLKTTFRLIDEKSNISPKKIENLVRKIRNVYLRSLGKRFGVVILRQKKEEFFKQIADAKEKLEEYKKEIALELNKEFNKCRTMIVDIFLPLIIANPPDSLRGGILSNKPTAEQARTYLENILEGIFPDPLSFVSNMNLNCDFKDVTYEMLNNTEFQEALKEKYPYVTWPKPYVETETAPQK